jgi:membrane-associated protein
VTSLLDRLLTLHGPLVYLVIGAVVFAEDALFVGFVIPGETAAVLGGVMASRGSTSLAIMIACVIGAAIIGDSVGYEVGRHVGPRILQWHVLDKHRRRLEDAQAFLRRRGGVAVFLGRFVAFFRAVMPALAGTARMSYRRFLAFNALGGAVWGATFVLVGYLAGNSYKQVEKTVGRGAAFTVAALLVVALIGWRWRAHRTDRQ